MKWSFNEGLFTYHISCYGQF